MPARLVEWTRIVLLAADGQEKQKIARRMKFTAERTACASALPAW